MKKRNVDVHTAYPLFLNFDQMLHLCVFSEIMFGRSTGGDGGSNVFASNKFGSSNVGNL